MIIQGYPDELDYVNAKLHPRAGPPGSFLEAFCRAALAADGENYELIRPALLEMMKKYPAEECRLIIERIDSGRASDRDFARYHEIRKGRVLR